MNGRNLLSFASLSAGVTPQAFNRGTQFGAAGSSRSQCVTVEGGRDSSTNYAIDGVYVRSLRFNNLSLEPAARRGAGSERPAQLVHRPSTARARRSFRSSTKSGDEPAQRAQPTSYRAQRQLRRAELLRGRSRATQPGRGHRAAARSCRTEFFVFGGYEALRTTARRRSLRRCRIRRC